MPRINEKDREPFYYRFIQTGLRGLLVFALVASSCLSIPNVAYATNNEIEQPVAGYEEITSAASDAIVQDEISLERRQAEVKEEVRQDCVAGEVIVTYEDTSGSFHRSRNVGGEAILGALDMTCIVFSDTRSRDF